MRHIDIALTQVGVEEIPHGSNWGPRIAEYLASVGIDFPASWCMAFVYWCMDQSGNNPLVKTGGVLRQWNEIPQELKQKYPQEGDIFIMDFGKGLGHCGFVTQVVFDQIHTIEGNSNNQGVRDGFEVCRRIRKISACKGFIRVT